MNFRRICEEKINIIKEQKGNKELYIWGAGEGGKILLEVLKENEIVISGFVDSNAENIDNCMGYPVFSISTMNAQKHYLVVSIMSIQYEIYEQMDKLKFTRNDYLYLSENEGYNKEDIYYKGCRIGRYTYGYEELLQYYPLATSIGRYCSINGTAKIWANHPLDYLTTHPILDYPMFFSSEKFDERKKLIAKYGTYTNNVNYENSLIRKNEPITIGNDVWIGANVIILPGVHIGNGAIIAAGAIVAEDVKPYAVVGGVPAKIIKYRFTTEEIEILERVQWWNWSIEEVENKIELLFNPKMFFDEISF